MSELEAQSRPQAAFIFTSVVFGGFSLKKRSTLHPHVFTVHSPSVSNILQGLHAAHLNVVHVIIYKAYITFVMPNLLQHTSHLRKFHDS